MKNTTTPVIQQLARRLIAAESGRLPSAGPVAAAVRVCEGLRASLSKLAGVAGFRSLMARAMALAVVEVPWLAAVQVRTDGSLDEWESPAAARDAEEAGRGGEAIVGQLLGLLVTFIGEPLTWGILRDAWPDAPITEPDAANGGAS